MLVTIDDDDFITAMATDSPDPWPSPTALDVLDLHDPDGRSTWLVSQGERFAFDPEYVV